MKQIEYVIGQLIKFNPSREAISLLSNLDTMIILTPACARLLVYLIDSQGVIISREAIFTCLWEKYGYSPSNGSLNTYISFIRKCFVNLGFTEEVIKTIPKIGFLFNPNVLVEIIEEKQNDSISESHGGADDKENNNCYDVNQSAYFDEHGTETPEEKKHIQINDGSKNGSQRLNINNYWLLFFASLITLVWGGVSMLDYQEKEIFSITSISVGKDDGCDIRFLPVHAGDSIMFNENQAIYMVRQSGFTCKPGGVFYLYADKNVTAEQRGKVYVSYCQKNSSAITSCRDFMDHNMTLLTTM